MLRLKNMLKRLGEVQKKGRKTREVWDSARSAGFKDGKNTNINKPIAGGRTAASSVKLLD